jgi:hypothetical protein
MLDRSDRRQDLPDGDIRKRLGSIEGVDRIMRALPEAREPFWIAFVKVAKTNPNALRYIVMLMALYMHLGPFSTRRSKSRVCCGGRYGRVLRFDSLVGWSMVSPF